MLQMLGLSSALQFVIEGAAIAIGMALSGIDVSRLMALIGGRRAPSGPQREKPSSAIASD
jgi:hypothetical protein